MTMESIYSDRHSVAAGLVQLSHSINGKQDFEIPVSSWSERANPALHVPGVKIVQEELRSRGRHSSSLSSPKRAVQQGQGAVWLMRTEQAVEQFLRNESLAIRKLQVQSIGARPKLPIPCQISSSSIDPRGTLAARFRLCSMGGRT
jgi:hypothetical protein